MAKLFTAYGPAGSAVILYWEIHNFPTRNQRLAEAWFVARTGQGHSNQRFIFEERDCHGLPIDHEQFVLSRARHWVDSQAWRLAPASAKFSDGFGEPIAEDDQILPALIELGVDCPSMLNCIRDTTQARDIGEMCSVAQGYCEHIQGEPMEA